MMAALGKAPPSRAVCDRLLCDEMLIRLGRWLRAAGYDTAIATARGADRALVDDSHHAGARIFNVGDDVALNLDAQRVQVLAA